MIIFGPNSPVIAPLGGASYTTLTRDGAPAYITLAASANSGNAFGDSDGKSATSRLGMILQGRAPANQISIQQSVDSSENKAFSGDYLIMAFGYSPIAIDISGLDIFKNACGEGWSQKDTVQSFFDSYNMYKNPKARIYVGVSGSERSTAFCCVLKSLKRTKGMSDATNSPFVGQYSISLIGVRI